MRDAELSIIQSVITFAETNHFDVADLTFDLTVNVTFGELIDQSVFALIRAEPDFPPNAPDLEDFFKAKIAAVVDSPLRRVTNCVLNGKPTLRTARAARIPCPASGPICGCSSNGRDA